MSNKNITFPADIRQRMHADAKVPAGARFDAADYPWARGLAASPVVMQHMDTAGLVYLVRQLASIREGVMMKEYPELKASEMFPWNTEDDAAAASFITRQGESKGMPEITKGLKGDAPRVDLEESEVEYKYHSFWLSYGYGIMDSRTAAFTGKALPTRYAVEVRDMMARSLDDIAYFGNTTLGVKKAAGVSWKGALTLTGTETYTVPLTGVGGLGTFASKDSDQILLDLGSLASQVLTNSKEVERPQTMLMATSLHEALNNRRVGDGTSMSIIKYFESNDSNITKIYRSHKCATAGSGGVTRTMVYDKNPTKLEFAVSVPFEQFAPGTSENGLEVMTVTHTRTAGMVAHRPKSIIFADGF